MDWMKRAWSGEERLWKVFWIYGFVFNLILAIIGVVIGLFLGPVGTKAFSVITFAYFVFIAVSEWRCAFNANWRGWGYVVRVLVILGAIGQVAIMVTNFRSGDMKQSYMFGKHATIKLDTQHGDTSLKLIPVTPAATPAPPMVVDPTSPTTTIAPVAAPAPATTAGQEDQYRANCEQTMTDYAKKNGADPKLYIAQNQAYIQKCIQYYKDKTAVGR